jgi:hypothetical protein
MSANSSQFKVDVSHWDATVTGVDYYSNLHLGDILTGAVVTYVGCKEVPYLVARIDFYPVTQSPTCTRVRVVPDPNAASGSVELIDCSYTVHQGSGGTLVINPNNSPDCTCLIRSEAGSWGRVKGLYR